MKKLLLLPVLLCFSGLALGQTNLPPCDPNNPPPNCTDYFGVANWANSPLPAGTITGFTVVASGSGYATPVVFITDASGTGASAPATFTFDPSGGIATITGGGGGSGYIAPQITIVDVGAGGNPALPTCGGRGQTACGSGALATAILGGPFTGGMRKFVDTLTLPLANLQLAAADPTTFPGSDFYVIALKQYTTKMHTDLPATTLRGYCQIIAPATDCTPSYLGPTIVAQKNRPVRVLFKNMLPTGTGGNLFIPTDPTYMGAGAPYTQNRATLHLHGGATPWISDGTPHQWTVPIGETGGPQRGDSAQLVPDMWFDSTGNVVPAGTPGATNDPGQGSLTFYWTNQQGGRLMFYHDHAYGITRLNVYAGEAAGYLLVDPAEEAALAASTVPGTLTGTPDLTHLVPLVIQDKTFVPSAAQLAVEDPTWTSGGFGTISGVANPGDLWFPHIYMPNQNPADVGGANTFGRWDYGPWTLPGAQTTLSAANPASAVTIACTSSAFPNQAVQCPITPNPSGTPEGFMDTPLVNGKAYPVLHVAPEAYRFQILSAGNDRSFNLQLYLADPTVTTADGRTNTEVKMLPAVPPSPGTLLPLCTTITPITNTTLFMGLATAVLTNGNPINGTGLPANCWPNFGAGSQAAGIPIQQTMWGADGRAGGVPDPRTAGPPFIQIGTEGGLLPAPVVIPSMPIGYEANTRSVTITNVSVHGLWLGTAERADAIVDFSAFGGKTLILYNDAPTPAPAIDSRTDYFTGDGDQTPIGGAPDTKPGYGPNTRTIMQIVVDQATSSTVPFSLSTLSTALPSLFAQTQPAPVVPEPTYPPASGGYSATPSYALISDASLTFYPIGSTTPVTYTDERKAIQELFTLDYGRMNATLGVELPLTNFLTQTTIPLGYVDPPTEIIKQGDTKFWKITHNGVDTHFIHFHLFNVQVINRMAWDGTKRPPDANELGWKDTVRMNPLEDILVVLQPIKPVLPFPVRDSYRLMDVTMPVGSDCAVLTASSTPTPCSLFTNIDPNTNIGVQTPNKLINFGWEYVWHCHILGHEENDMMRAIAFQVPPEAPSNLIVTAATLPQTGLNLNWTDNSASETGFTLERAGDANFSTNVVDTVVPPISPDPNGQGITWGGTLASNDANATSGPYFYRVQAFKPDANYWTVGANITSAWSNTVIFGTAAPFAAVSPTTLDFGNVATTLTQTVTLSNTGPAALTFTPLTALSFTGLNPGDFTESDTCGGTVAANSSCLLSVTFTPAAAGPRTATLTIATTNDLAHPTLTVLLTGTSGLPALTITASNATMKYGAAVPPITPSYTPSNPVGPLTAPTCTTTATSTSPVGNYPTICTGAVDANYAIAYVAGTISVTPVPLTIWASNGAMVYGGTPPVITPKYVGFVAGDTAASLTTQPTCTTTPVLTSTTPIGTYPSSCTGAVDPNYTISYVDGTITVAKAALTITSTATRIYGAPDPVPFPLTGIGLVNGDTIPVLGIVVTCTTTATTASPVGTYPITCTGPASTPTYVITYATGTLTISQATLTVTADNATKVYGAPLPSFTATVTGFVNGDTVAVVSGSASLATTATAASPFGTYPITAVLGTLAATNYTFTFVNGTLTVSQAPLTVTANNLSMIYGGIVPQLTATTVGLVAPDTLASIGVVCGTTATAASPVGAYPITCSGTPANYTVTYTAGTLTVNPASLTVTASNATKVYGAPLPTLTSTIAGLVNGDTLAVVSGSASLTTTATTASPVGTYPITAALGTLSATNYTFTFVNGTLTVTRATLTVTANNATKAFGAPLPTLTANITGFVNGDTVAVVSGSPNLTTTAIQTSSVGSYPITAALGTLTAANYTFTFGNGTLTVAPIPLVITASSGTMIYGGAVPVITPIYNPANPIGVTPPTCSTAATAVSNVGTYVSSCIGAISANYAPISYLAGAVTVTRAPLVVTAPTLSRVWGFANPALTPVITGFANGQTAAVLTTQPTCSTTATAVSAVGIYPVTCTGGTAVNYAFASYVAGTLTITNAVQLTPGSLTFAAQILNTNSPFQTLTLRNLGGATLTAISVTFTGANPADFLRGGAGGGSCGTTLAAGATCTINARFRPVVTGALAATLSVAATGGNSGGVGLTGTGNGAVAAVSPATTTAAPYNFGNVTRGQVSAPLTVQVTNTGTTSMTFNAANGFTLGGGSAGQFRLTTGGSCVNGGTLPALASCTLTVNFAPTAGTARNTKNSTVTIRSNATNGNQLVHVRGTAQ